MNHPNTNANANAKPRQTLRQRRRKEAEPAFDAPMIQAIKTPRRGVVDHSYREFSQLSPHPGYEAPLTIDDMTFSEKIHDILAQPGYEKLVTWMPHGRAFKVLVPSLFESQVCPRYFGHRSYLNFLRDLNCYGFKHISRGVDRNCKCHTNACLPTPRRL